MVGGLFRIIGSLVFRFPHWGWTLVGGAINLLLGILIWQQWPEAALGNRAFRGNRFDLHGLDVGDALTGAEEREASHGHSPERVTSLVTSRMSESLITTGTR